LKFLNVINSQGGGPAHLSVDPSGKWVFAANYGTGTVVVAPIRTDGSLGDAADVQSIPTSPLGPHQAQDGPRYRFADSGHDAPHSHMTQTDPAGNLLAVPHRQAVNAVLEVDLAGATASCREYSYPPQRMWRRCSAQASPMLSLSPDRSGTAKTKPEQILL